MLKKIEPYWLYCEISESVFDYLHAPDYRSLHILGVIAILYLQTHMLKGQYEMRWLFHIMYDVARGQDTTANEEWLFIRWSLIIGWRESLFCMSQGDPEHSIDLHGQRTDVYKLDL